MKTEKANYILFYWTNLNSVAPKIDCLLVASRQGDLLVWHQVEELRGVAQLWYFPS